jgi:protein-ribulosamine 3-kinase
VTLTLDLRELLAGSIGPIGAVSSVGGGCIGSARRIEARGETLFLKFDRVGTVGFYEAEADGLEMLHSAGSGVRVPRVIDYRDDLEGWSWIALEWLDQAPASARAWSALGSGLARLHRTAADDSWGWHRDGYIGSLPQSNTPTPGWPEFWVVNRLRPQRDRARPIGSIGSDAEWEQLFAALPRLLHPAEADGVSLLHGDLWNGNILMTTGGPALVDPSCYRGHREVDLAMAELFGGFSELFFANYEATWPLQSGYEVRRSVYQLYYLLVHVNLFGSSYAGRTAATLRSVLASL